MYQIARVLISLIILFLLVARPLHAQTLLASIDDAGAGADASSLNADISFDSSMIVFESGATNLVPDDQNGLSDIFLHRQTLLQAEPVSNPVQQTTRVSVSDDEKEANGSSFSPSISDTTGRFVTFVSAASNLVAGDTNGFDDIFIRDLTRMETYRISLPHDISGVPQGESNGHSFTPRISADGCFVVFASDASNLNALDGNATPLADTNGKRDVFLYYNPQGENGCFGGTPYIELISVGRGNVIANDESYAPYFSTVRFVSFTSRATNLVEGDTNNFADIFLRDRAVSLGENSVERTTTLVSVNLNGTAGNAESFTSVVDGSDIVFDSAASDLVSGDSNGKRDVFRRNLITDGRSGGETTLISQTISGVQGNGDSFSPVVAAGLNYIAFVTMATNLAERSDCNLAGDIMVRDFILGTLRRVNLTTSGYQAPEGASAGAPALAGAGLLVAYQTTGMMNTGDRNRIQDIYLSVASEDPRQQLNPLQKGERLDEKPETCLVGRKAEVVMENFSSVAPSLSNTAASTSGSFPCRGQGVCYQTTAAPVTSKGAADRKRTRIQVVSRRNSVTIPRLKPGNYAVSFRVFGKAGSRVVKTNQSPARMITVR